MVQPAVLEKTRPKQELSLKLCLLQIRYGHLEFGLQPELEQAMITLQEMAVFDSLYGS